MCIAESAQAEITMAGDFLWGMKVLFNPSIKGTGYSSGTAGYIEMLVDLGQVRATLTEIKTAIGVDPLRPKWPSTSTVPDALKATLDIMHAPAEQIKIRSSYNLAAMSFGPEEIAAAIQKYIPDFTITYKIDSRQQIAESWPAVIDDSRAREDWGWKPNYDLDKMTVDMLENLKNQYGI
jgi:hypothetical protein